MYASAASDEPENFGLPPDLAGWTRQAGMAIQLGKGRPSIAEKSRPGEGAPPLEGKFMMVGTSLLSVVMAAFTVIVAYAMFFRR